MNEWSIATGDCRNALAEMGAATVQTCITSPPYFGLRDYGVDGQIGAEETPEQYVEQLVTVFREVRRVLCDDGTLWLNLGDSYAGSWGNQGRKETRGTQRPINKPMMQNVGKTIHAIDCDMDEDCACERRVAGVYQQRTRTGSWVNSHPTLKPKDLIGVPWRVAFALQTDGWYLRSEVIWHKPNPMPESICDRPTKAHEHIFMLTKSPRYFFDSEAASEASEDGGRRNRRTVWTVPTSRFDGAHFATFPPALIEPCVLASSRVGDVVLDPFTGAGTTGLVALKHQRSFRGIELNHEYAEMARRRIEGDMPLLNRRSA